MIFGRTMSVLVLAVALLVVSCGATERLTLDEYADRAAEIADAYVQESQDVSFQYQREVEQLIGEIAASGSSTVIEEAVVVMRTETASFLALIDDAMARYIEAFGALEPPDEISGAHQAYVDVMASVHDALPAMRDSVANASSLGDIEAALAGSAFADGQPVWTASCLTLEQDVRDLGRGLDLKCERSEVAP